MLRQLRTTLYAVVVPALLAATLVAPAHAGDGKRAFGSVRSFDGTMLTVDMGNGGTLVAPVDDDVQIKVEHRGKKARGKGHKKPSNGTVADLKPGTMILRIKVVCSEVIKLRLRRAPATQTAAATADDTSSTQSGVLADGETTESTTDDDPCDDDDDADDDTDEKDESSDTVPETTSGGNGTGSGDDTDDDAEDSDAEDGDAADDSSDSDGGSDDGSDEADDEDSEDDEDSDDGLLEDIFN